MNDIWWQTNESVISKFTMNEWIAYKPRMSVFQFFRKTYKYANQYILHRCFKMVFLEVKSENERFFLQKNSFFILIVYNFFNIYAMFMK